MNIQTSTTVLKKSKSNFALAFLGLPRDQRRAMEAVYAYCRTVDDIVDESPNIQKAETELNFWKSALANWPNFSSILPVHVAQDLEWAVQKFPILKSDLVWILEGVEKDLRPNRYRTLEELLVYCDGVASAVGFCCMAIFDVDRKASEAYVFATGRALQLTNILRDIASDARRGRIYIPQNLLHSHQVTEEDLFQSSHNKAFLNMVGDLSKKITEYYTLAEHEARKLPLKKIWPAEVMRKTYFEIFKKIQTENFDVFSQKISLGKIKKFWIAITQPRS
jgi:phytoene synthase